MAGAAHGHATKSEHARGHPLPWMAPEVIKQPAYDFKVGWGGRRARAVARAGAGAAGRGRPALQRPCGSLFRPRFLVAGHHSHELAKGEPPNSDLHPCASCS